MPTLAQDWKNRYFPIPVFVILGFVLQLVVANRFGEPVPTIHDEFAYLLTGDTFAHGRLSNPSHPLWEHFQTFHVFFRPTYQAKYPPAQGAFLAIGQVFSGRPIWGVWLSLALAYGATYWLFLSKFRPAVAVFGTLLLVIHPYILGHWGHTYFGGSVALLGGALFFGGLRHSHQKMSLSNSIAVGLGVVILANSRPFESLVVVILSLPVMIDRTRLGIAKDGIRKTVNIWVIPLFVLALLLIAWILYYNYVLVGLPFRFYYLNWDKHTATVELIRNYAGSPSPSIGLKLVRLWIAFIGFYLSLAFLGVPILLKRKVFLFEIACIVVLTLVSVNFSRAWPHYLAPVVSLLFFVLFSGMHEMAHCKIFKNKKVPMVLLGGFWAIYLTGSVFSSYQLFERGPIQPYFPKLLMKPQIVDDLESEEGKDLIIVKYGENHLVHEEWVYNAADIDESEVVWARDLGSLKNRKLFEYYHERNIWEFYPDRDPVELVRVSTPQPEKISSE